MNLATFNDQFIRFKQMSAADGRFEPKASEMLPVLNEDTPSHTSRDYDWSYLLHTNWAARKLFQSKPKRHVDIGSYVYFAALCSAFIPEFEFYDVRALSTPVPGLKRGEANLTDLPFADNSIPSLSCLHTLEHVGLARYGDELDAKGDIRAAKELMRVLAPGGELLMVLPMDEHPRVLFNAHRLYSFKQALALFDGLYPAEFTALYEEKVIYMPSFSTPDISGTYTGCLVFTKL